MLARTRVVCPHGRTAGSRGINTRRAAAERLVAQRRAVWCRTPAASTMREERAAGNGRSSTSAAAAGAAGSGPRLTRRDGRPSGRAGSWRSTGEDRADLSRAHIACESPALTSSSPPPRQHATRRARRAALALHVSRRYRGTVRAARWWRPRSGARCLATTSEGTPVTTSVFASRRGPLFLLAALTAIGLLDAQHRQSVCATRRRATPCSVGPSRRLVIGLPP